MEEPGPKPIPDPEAFGDITGKFIGLMTEEVEEDDGTAAEISPEIPIREELIEEVMQELYREISSNGPGLGPGFGPARPKSFDINNESCGASFSESASTVMAGLEYVASAGEVAGRNVGSPAAMWRECGCDWSWGDEGFDDEVMMIKNNNSTKKNGVVEMDGCDRGSDDDEWLARVLSWGPLEIGPWF
uniref:Uncharacterized protein n=1 Tax=Cannabis sativa TaxID=3483 RepID=A0A803NG11_CANSA